MFSERRVEKEERSNLRETSSFLTMSSPAAVSLTERAGATASQKMVSRIWPTYFQNQRSFYLSLILFNLQQLSERNGPIRNDRKRASRATARGAVQSNAPGGMVGGVFKAPTQSSCPYYRFKSMGTPAKAKWDAIKVYSFLLCFYSNDFSLIVY